MAPLIPVLEVIDFMRAPYRRRAAVPIPQQHIKTAFKARGQARVPKAPRAPHASKPGSDATLATPRKAPGSKSGQA